MGWWVPEVFGTLNLFPDRTALGMVLEWSISLMKSHGNAMGINGQAGWNTIQDAFIDPRVCKRL